MNKFIKNYTTDLKDLLEETISYNINYIKTLKDNIINCKKNNQKIILLGNGGSSATCSHVSVDLTKNAEIRAVNFNEYDLITCFANDFGHENWMAQALRVYSDKKDFVILLSASGESKNILNAASWLKKNKIKFATFSGMKKNNSIKVQNKNNINIWVNSMSYNKVEILHHYILLMIIDLIIDEYKKKKKEQ